MPRFIRKGGAQRGAIHLFWIECSISKPPCRFLVRRRRWERAHRIAGRKLRVPNACHRAPCKLRDPRITALDPSGKRGIGRVASIFRPQNAAQQERVRRRGWCLRGESAGAQHDAGEQEACHGSQWTLPQRGAQGGSAPGELTRLLPRPPAIPERKPYSLDGSAPVRDPRAAGLRGGHSGIMVASDAGGI